MFSLVKSELHQWLYAFGTPPTKICLAIVLVLGIFIQATWAVNPLPRIVTEEGLFKNSITNQQFIPRGFNYVRLNGVNGWHNTFEPGQYDPAAVEAMLIHLEANNFNTTRVFVDPTIGPGSVANQTDAFLSPAYMMNVYDYLQRSRNHGVYTVFAFSWLVGSDHYNNIINSTTPAFTGPMAEANLLYLHSGVIAAKAQWMADFAGSILSFDPDLSSTILSYQIENEAAFSENFAPFSLASGTVTGPDNTVYDLSVAADRLALADAGAEYWGNTTRQIIKTADPNALVSTGLFSNLAVGRSGFGQTSTFGDPRFPLNPSALLDTDLDFLDFHLYPSNSFSLQQELGSIDWDQTQAKAAAHETPIMAGELGSFKSNQSTITDAINTINNHLDEIESEGFEGSLLWTYDTNEQPSIWNAQEANGAIFDALAARYPALPGDYDGNGIVDAADYTKWRDTLGSTTDLAADGDGNGTVEQADYVYWSNRFGNTSPSTSTSNAVPEPSSFLLLGLAGIFLCAWSGARAQGDLRFDQ